jgi:hypothetical protein
MSKVYEGQPVTQEGSLCGDFPYITKMAYNSAMAVEYIGECKFGRADADRNHYIQKLEYDAALNVTRILIAQNLIYADATQATITVSSSDVIVQLDPSGINGDFEEVRTDDALFLTTPTQAILNVPVIKIDKYTLRLRKSADAPNLATLVNEIAVINKIDCYCQLNHADAKPFSKRRWDLRTRYSYL